MLSVLFMESGDALAHLVRFYAPEARMCLDLSYGGGTLTKRLSIPVLGVDKDATTGATIITDLLHDGLKSHVENESVEVAVFDPPYLYGSKAAHMGPIGEKTWNNARSTWKTPEQLACLSGAVAAITRRVLIPNGVTIVKIMDSRFKGRLVRNHALVIDQMERAGHRLADLLVYIRTVTGSFVNTVSAQNAHGYYLVFRKGVDTPKKRPIRRAHIGADVARREASSRAPR